VNRKLRVGLFPIETGIRYYVALGFSDVAISNGWRILNSVSHRFPLSDAAFAQADVMITFDAPAQSGRSLATNFHKVLGLTPSEYRSRFRL
jgi:hypothetical protein